MMSTETPRLIFLTKHLISYTKLYRGMINHSLPVFDQMGITQGVLELLWQYVKNACQPDQTLPNNPAVPILEGSYHFHFPSLLAPDSDALTLNLLPVAVYQILSPRCIRSDS